MPREILDRQTQHLLDEVLVLGHMVEQAILDSVQALKARDLEAARCIYNGDKKVNEKRFEIENSTMITIATQQPIMAGDLRLLASIMEVTSELERMGDYAKGIAHICLMMGNQKPIKPLIDIPRMAEIAVSMLHRALNAFIEKDIETAKVIPQEDDVVDALYQQVHRELMTYVLADASIIDRADYLLWVAHNLERVADRVTNICERTIYIVTGKLEEIDTSNDELIRDQPA
ncbi:MAG: phosphate signaling complex protein PhoU [Anaerolineales bacterium]|nr:phosphate signaling complex protein PhoU [Anaerolineales bacterium]